MRSSSTSHNSCGRLRRAIASIAIALGTLPLVDTAYAVDPDRAMSQYIRDEWGLEQGFPGGSVHAIAQTSDGYLWIGAEKGLVRFDGARFRLLPPSASPPAVLGLVADADGSLWVRLRGPTLLRYRNAAFETVMPDRARPDVVITAMSPTQDGAVLLSGMGGGTMVHRGGRFETLVSSIALPPSLIIAVGATPGGDVWMGTRDAGLLRLDAERQLSAITKGLPDQKINCLAPAADGTLWVGTDRGVVRWDGTKITRSGGPSALDEVQALAMLEDRESNLWVGTASGRLLRLTSAGQATFDTRRTPSSGPITALFEDREGNIWVGTERGIERIRDAAFVTYSTSEGLPSDVNGPIHVDARRRTWFAPANGGLYWLDGTRVARITESGLDRDIVYSIAGAGDEVWIGRQRGGLTRLAVDARGSVSATTYTQRDGLAQDSVYAVHRARDGSVWAGTLSGGISRVHDRRVTTYTTRDGLASNTISAIADSADSTMWLATPRGISALKDGQWQTYSAADGLPSETVHALFEDAKGVLWAGTAAGLAFLKEGRFHAPTGTSSIGDQMFGLAQDTSGSLWISSSNRVLRVDRDALVRGVVDDADVRELGLADGLHGVEGVRRHRSVVADDLGRIWFSMDRGVSMVDPARVSRSSVPALAQIEAVAADGNPIDFRGAPLVPAGSQRITFTYTGLSLAIPERVRFRYWLEGFDRDWSEPLSAREAVYTNLNPGAYRFHVKASTGDGAWSGDAAVIGFAIAPAFWQTTWFRLASVMAVAAAAWGAYRVRVRQVARQLTVRFEERLAERNRIAQELHDTLLQGFLSASMQLHVAADQLPADSPAKSSLGRVLDLMGRVIEEGRNAVRGLRASMPSDDLEQAFIGVRQELAPEAPIEFRVIVEGRPRPLHPIIRDEVYRIGREALVNAFRHSGAGRVEVELDYAASHVRMLVRDNGRGIDPDVLQSGRDGHWGLSGMRERADRIGARFKVWSRAAAGTEVDLLVPGGVAFQPDAATRRVALWKRWRAPFKGAMNRS